MTKELDEGIRLAKVRLDAVDRYFEGYQTSNDHLEAIMAMLEKLDLWCVTISRDRKITWSAEEIFNAR